MSFSILFIKKKEWSLTGMKTAPASTGEKSVNGPADDADWPNVVCERFTASMGDSTKAEVLRAD